MKKVYSKMEILNLIADDFCEKLNKQPEELKATITKNGDDLEIEIEAIKEYDKLKISHICVNCETKNVYTFPKGEKEETFSCLNCDTTFIFTIDSSIERVGGCQCQE